MKKRCFLLVVVWLCLCLLPLSALAQGESGSTITIVNDQPGHIYYVYQILKGDVAEIGGEGILSNPKWGEGAGDTFKSNVARIILGDSSVEITPEQFADYLTQADDSALKSIADLYATHAANGEVIKDENGGTQYSKGGFTPGYYYVMDKSGTLTGKHDSYTGHILELLKDDITIQPKSYYPDFCLKVYEEDYSSSDDEKLQFGEKYNDVADYSIDESIKLRMYASVPENVDSYETYSLSFHFEAAAGMTIGELSRVFIKGSDQTIEASSYKITQNTADEIETFTLAFEDIKDLGTIEAGDEIVVECTASLGSGSTIGLPGNVCSASLTFSNHPNGNDTGTTASDKVVIYTYGFELSNVDGVEQDTLLSGAEFILKKGEEFIEVENGVLNRFFPTEANATLLKIGDSGQLSVSGLEDGEWTLIQKKAPEGYNLIKDPITFTIQAQTSNGQNWDMVASALTSLQVDDVENSGILDTGLVHLKAENNRGYVLPHIGLSGERMFYLIGVLLISLSIAVALYKKVSEKRVMR